MKKYARKPILLTAANHEGGTDMKALDTRGHRGQFHAFLCGDPDNGIRPVQGARQQSWLVSDILKLVRLYYPEEFFETPYRGRVDGRVKMERYSEWHSTAARCKSSVSTPPTGRGFLRGRVLGYQCQRTGCGEPNRIAETRER